MESDDLRLFADWAVQHKELQVLLCIRVRSTNAHGRIVIKYAGMCNSILKFPTIVAEWAEHLRRTGICGTSRDPEEGLFMGRTA